MTRTYQYIQLISCFFELWSKIVDLSGTRHINNMQVNILQTEWTTWHSIPGNHNFEKYNAYMQEHEQKTKQFYSPLDSQW